MTQRSGMLSILGFLALLCTRIPIASAGGGSIGDPPIPPAPAQGKWQTTNQGCEITSTLTAAEFHQLVDWILANPSACLVKGTAESERMLSWKLTSPQVYAIDHPLDLKIFIADVNPELLPFTIRGPAWNTEQGKPLIEIKRASPFAAGKACGVAVHDQIRLENIAVTGFDPNGLAICVDGIDVVLKKLLLKGNMIGVQVSSKAEDVRIEETVFQGHSSGAIQNFALSLLLKGNLFLNNVVQPVWFDKSVTSKFPAPILSEITRQEDKLTVKGKADVEGSLQLESVELFGVAQKSMSYAQQLKNAVIKPLPGQACTATGLQFSCAASLPKEAVAVVTATASYGGRSTEFAYPQAVPAVSATPAGQAPAVPVISDVGGTGGDAPPAAGTAAPAAAPPPEETPPPSPTVETAPPPATSAPTHSFLPEPPPDGEPPADESGFQASGPGGCSLIF
ncbi:MAG: hypothetical protein HY543_02395 [Deltaproteobacteria bacterium]|nr:hypothetical protein [Deltaproteobacteria bacterium]